MSKVQQEIETGKQLEERRVAAVDLCTERWLARHPRIRERNLEARLGLAQLAVLDVDDPLRPDPLTAEMIDDGLAVARALVDLLIEARGMKAAGVTANDVLKGSGES
jgi:hypothetical protein